MMPSLSFQGGAATSGVSGDTKSDFAGGDVTGSSNKGFYNNFNVGGTMAATQGQGGGPDWLVMAGIAAAAFGAITLILRR